MSEQQEVINEALKWKSDWALLSLNLCTQTLLQTPALKTKGNSLTLFLPFHFYQSCLQWLIPRLWQVQLTVFSQRPACNTRVVLNTWHKRDEITAASLVPVQPVWVTDQLTPQKWVESVKAKWGSTDHKLIMVWMMISWLNLSLVWRLKEVQGHSRSGTRNVWWCREVLDLLTAENAAVSILTCPCGCIEKWRNRFFCCLRSWSVYADWKPKG